MKTETKLKCLPYALSAVGVIFLLGIYPLMQLWPSGWRWEPFQPKYEQMILGIYATLGIFLLLAAKNPLKNRSLIWFTVWSSAVHATIMLVQAVQDTHHISHLYGDVPALYIVAAVLAYLMPPKSKQINEKKLAMD